MALEAGWSLVSRKTKMPSYSSTGRDLAGRFRWRPYSLGDIADGNALIADGVEHRARGSLLDSQPVEDRGGP